MVEQEGVTKEVGPASPASNPRYEGELVRIGDLTYVIPSLSVKQARMLWPKIVELNKGITEENLSDKFAIAVDVIHAAMSRNYPDLKRDDLEDLVDLKNLRRLILVVSGQSGYLGPGLGPVAADAVVK